MRAGHMCEAEARRLRYQGNGEFAQDGRLSRVLFRENNGVVTGFVVTRYGAVLGRLRSVQHEGLVSPGMDQ